MKFYLKEKQIYRLDNISDKIYEEIDKSGFDVAASMYSISESKNFGGKLGWIKSNQISKKFILQLARLKILPNLLKNKKWIFDY